MNSIYLHGDIENAMGFDIPRRTNVSDFSSLDDGIYSCIVDGNHCTLFYWKAVADYAPTGFINNGLVVSNGDFDSYDYAKKQYLAKNLEI